jgi:hypothetical protein
MKYTSWIVGLAFGLILAPTLWAADPIIGTWKLDVSKSSYKPGPAPLSQTRVYAPSPNGVTVTVTTTFAEGVAEVATYESVADGKDYPVTGRSPEDAVSMLKVDDHVSQASLKHAGKLIAFVLREVSEDGKTMQITYTGYMIRNGVEERVSNVAAYLKQ